MFDTVPARRRPTTRAIHVPLARSVAAKCSMSSVGRTSAASPQRPWPRSFVAMQKSRLEAFSDGVIAIIITIMVLELKAPHGDQVADLAPLWPVALSYVLSFVYIAIYWNNHHHMLHTVK